MEGKLRFTIDWATVSVKMVGTLGVSLSHQCWCTRFGDRTAINNFETDEVSRRREKTAFGLSVPTIFV